MHCLTTMAKINREHEERELATEKQYHKASRRELSRVILKAISNAYNLGIDAGLKAGLYREEII